MKKNTGNTFQRIKIFARKKSIVCAVLLIECTAMLYKENLGSSVLYHKEQYYLIVLRHNNILFEPR